MICMIENGVVVQVWRDVKSLAELEAKYGLTGPDYIEAEGAPGFLWDGVALKAPPVVVPPPPPLVVDPLFEALDLIVAALNPAQQAAIIAKLDEARARRGVA